MSRTPNPPNRPPRPPYKAAPGRSRASGTAGSRPGDRPRAQAKPSVAKLQPDSLAWAIKTAATCVTDVVAFGRSLTTVLADLRQQVLPANAVRAQAIDQTYATLRRYWRGDVELSLLLDRPTAEDELRSLLRVALCWLEMHPEKSHVGVDQAVEAAATLSGGRYRGFVNAILRRALREREALDAAIAEDGEARYQHPAWWLQRLQADWPEQWQAIVDGGNRKPPMGLRVNQLRSTADAYRQQLREADIAMADAVADDAPTAILLAQPQPAETLPGFPQGLVAVQDLGAQQAAKLLAVQPGMRVLDACAAPGGKAAHLLETAAIELTAVESDPERCAALTRALEPARFPPDRTINVICADAAEMHAAWAKRPFDAILLDAPCSGSGVSGRHPDAKWLRRAEDVDALARTQSRLLRALWPLLKPGGHLLYGTCSVFAQENQQQIERFLRETTDARLQQQVQLIPDARHDGFYYALLRKEATSQ